MRTAGCCLIVSASLLLGAGCDPAKTSPATEATGVGEGCTGDGDCREGLSCFEELPGGACTKECSPFSCPEETVCASATLPGGGQTSLCAPVCESDDECRDGYSCISVGRRSVCGI